MTYTKVYKIHYNTYELNDYFYNNECPPDCPAAPRKSYYYYHKKKRIKPHQTAPPPQESLGNEGAPGLGACHDEGLGQGGGQQLGQLRFRGRVRKGDRQVCDVVACGSV